MENDGSGAPFSWDVPNLEADRRELARLLAEHEAETKGLWVVSAVLLVILGTVHLRPMAQAVTFGALVSLQAIIHLF